MIVFGEQGLAKHELILKEGSYNAYHLEESIISSGLSFLFTSLAFFPFRFNNDLVV
jgi:hypothetical protein